MEQQRIQQNVRDLMTKSALALREAQDLNKTKSMLEQQKSTIQQQCEQELEEFDKRIGEIDQQLVSLLAPMAKVDFSIPTTVRKKRGPGRPKGSKNKFKVSVSPKAGKKRGPGRPKGSKNKSKAVKLETGKKRGPGRPKGSKNKSKKEASRVTIDARRIEQPSLKDMVPQIVNKGEVITPKELVNRLRESGYKSGQNDAYLASTIGSVLRKSKDFKKTGRAQYKFVIGAVKTKKTAKKEKAPESEEVVNNH